jgi:hypothetical protein
MFAKGPLASHNSLKIVVREILLKTFSMLICIMAQLKCKLRKVRMSKEMASQAPGVDIPN